MMGRTRLRDRVWLWSTADLRHRWGLYVGIELFGHNLVVALPHLVHFRSSDVLAQQRKDAAARRGQRAT